MSGRPIIATPLAIEAAMVRSAFPAADVVRAGFGHHAAAATARRLRPERDATPGFAVAGVCAAVDERLRPGDVVLADRLDDGSSQVTLRRSVLLEHELARRGLTVHRGTIRSVERILDPAQRAALRPTGAIAVDMESAWLVGAPDTPAVVLRTVVEPAGRSLLSPWVGFDGVRGLHSLRRAAGALDAWSRVLGSRRVLLAGPRSFCAGVDRAIEIVERALERRGAPIYVRRQIVHNAHVVGDLERRGAVFVEELGEVPEGATVVFSAHGVSPAVRAQAAARALDVIDATCPLVAKVHAEARRFSARGDNLVLIGHAGHEEVEGTMGEVPGAIHLVETPADVDRLALDPAHGVTYLTQTTLAIDDTAEVVDRLRARYPALAAPPADDICYATHNRQHALREVARESDLVLVVGSETSSNSRRLVEVAERMGTPAHLIDDESGIDLAWLRHAGVVGLTAGASAPEALVTRVVDALSDLGPVVVEDRSITRETTRFRLPKEVRD